MEPFARFHMNHPRFRELLPLKSLRLMGRLARECLRFPLRILWAAATLLILAVARLYLTWLVKTFSEGPLAGGDQAATHSLILLALTTTAVMAGAVFFSRYLLNDLNQRLLLSLRNRVQCELMRMALPAMRTFRQGDLFSRMFADVGALALFARDVLKRIIGEFSVAVGCIAMMFYLDWRLAAAICMLIPIVLYLLTLFSRMIREMAERTQVTLGSLGALFGEQMHGISAIRTFQAEEYEEKRFRDQNELHLRSSLDFEIWSALLVSIVWLVTGFGLVLLLWYGSNQVFRGRLSAGELLVFCLYAAQTVEPLRRLSDVYTSVQRCIAAASRVFEILDMSLPEKEGPLRLGTPYHAALRFEQVTFGYEHSKTVLHRLDLEIGPGRPTALVSASGGGKSTLAKLAIRFYDPSAGRVLLDGMDLRDLQFVDLRRVTCVVHQDPFVFRGTLFENVQYGSWDAPESAVESAIRMAGLENLSQSLSQGMHTLLLEGGTNLSGGQKQRIELARAIARNPRILIMDEATSAIDSETEGQVFLSMRDWLLDRTVLVMAHRLSTVARFERILVLDKGRIVMEGNLADLMASCPVFRTLFEEQIDATSASHNHLV